MDRQCVSDYHFFDLGITIDIAGVKETLLIPDATTVIDSKL